MANNFIKFYGARDISDENLLKDLKREVNSGITLHITPTANLQEMRQGITFLKSDNVKSFYFPVLLNKIKAEYFKSVLRNVSQKIILEKTIYEMYADQKAKRDTLMAVSEEIFELFNLLLLYDKNEIPADMFDIIASKYCTEASFFNLFNQFVVRLNNIRLEKSQLTYQESLKQGLNKYVEEHKFHKVFFDGFTFFNEMQKYLLKRIFNWQRKQGGFIDNLIFINKYNSRSKYSTILIKNIEQLTKETGFDHLKITKLCNYDSKYKGSKSLQYLKNNFLNINEQQEKNKKIKFDHQELTVMPPFISRGEELKYVAKEISKLLKNSPDPEKLLKGNAIGGICVVIPRDIKIYENKLSIFLQEYGLFKFPTDNLNSIIKEFNLNNSVSELKAKKYFSRQEFLNDQDIKLNLKEKNNLFERLQGLELNLSKKPIASYPIGQFIFKIYHILKNGLTIDDFKIILNSNWISEESSKYLVEFRKIQVFFTELEELEEWINEMEYLINIFYRISDDNLYQWHPIRSIKLESLQFLHDILLFIKKLFLNIKRTNASFYEHISLLQENITNYNKLKESLNSRVDGEKQVVDIIFKVIEDISVSEGKTKSPVEDISTIEFGEHIRGMIRDWEKDKEIAESDLGEIAIVELENMKHY